ncbi:GNAT family N-acetyltransferase [Xanthomonas hortorum]|uniref:GNAT family N-acetyltransferase n=1 Tax=Xanthomonas hortorum TaxID=56454 RepID=UPI0001FD5CF8|nr:GNAT family N-acetyltransferase [Xanthomonas hortorum]APP78823.1 GNAT family N-acetyltransferase [Xanthomonas hortorum pv. gardneri]EGD16996.1 acetyltransferase, ribosomal protein N-acetylase [Xanthomonas hortorum ATCC 19865]KLA91022.1 acetyltransferase [Xanthomonas hortorum pv. gardneri]KLA93682.1 acetyltransferase [Xanthomonas hortorum pv. gardneri]KLA99833.1 acetyltransferase [Xanthomonas hortorum pv. gardneri]
MPECAVTVVIETARLRLRTLDPECDADAILVLVNDPGFIAGINDRGVRTREQARDHLREWAQAHQETHGFAHWAVETREGAFAGTLGLLCRDTLPVPHIGFALLPAYRGKGYVTEAGRAVLTYARDVLGLSQLCAIVSPDNADSIRALEKLGLQRQGLRVLSQEADPVLYYTIDLAPAGMDS